MIKQLNPIKQKLALGQPVMGIWSIVSSPSVVEILSSSGIDFLILDMEHGTYGVEALETCIRAAEAAGTAPIVRVPGMNASAVQWALDLGAHGIIVPQVLGEKQAKMAVEMTKFAPSGTRGYNPFTRAGGYANASSNENGKLANTFGLTSIIVENELSLKELNEICAIDDLDMIYVGVYDLSIALGYNGNTLHPDLIKIVNETVKTIRNAGKAAGVMVRSESEITSALESGANVLVYGVDTSLIRQAMSAAVDAFKHSI
ncbi:aldolase/citrate lyase family protein [Pectobacterium aroidearum]|uniref:HpcH/HpaI aldolase family protein n=1 Tax=Pectobacterium aroidearum TaxID=1201031 RepID=UPI0032ED93F3